MLKNLRQDVAPLVALIILSQEVDIVNPDYAEAYKYKHIECNY